MGLRRQPLVADQQLLGFLERAVGDYRGGHGADVGGHDLGRFDPVKARAPTSSPLSVSS